ncbi:ATP-binding protein [Corynebacterium glucuronolyticum]|uniref:ATP-binding protein n=2 Tax=Corynebacterium TaxID=1716 RepID=A0A7U0HES1_9CORY|nr:ATP-binding protein [Corynebacterium glucuronolyticum]QQB46780.1 ATP-binding protein [Corynebacterium glucuronolyticum]QQB46785.1 ATP-binding protein [Corynebacterium glucuronolyticum]QQU88393.1 ATP-binding protein [Corynebacterium glucuronolyticum]QQU88469.1 ATP-binding protein [Corynebacterium glucuronolyticum]WKD62382.1 transposase [Corynebacterium glucuronolyticum DSM 44120]
MTRFEVDETTRQKMRTLRVSTFADVFFSIVTDEAHTDALAEDIFLAAVDEAFAQRTARNIDKAITQAKFRYPDATLHEVIHPDQRGINMRQLKRLAATNWRENPTNIHILAPTGTGKTYIACALGIAACQSGFSVAYYRLDQLVDELAVFLPTDQGYIDKMRKLCNIDVLIIDDFLTIGIDQRGQEDLTRIVFERDGRLPIIVSSQSTAAYWRETLPNPVGADSLVSRLNNGQRIKIGQYDMRRHLNTQNAEN